MAQHVHKERSFDAFLSSVPLLPELVEHIDVGTKWLLLGTLLHVDDKRLDGIEQLQGHDDTSKTLKMFQHWLTTTPTASRRQVLEVLRKSVVKQHLVADKYEKYLRELHDTISTEAFSIFQRNIQSLNKALVSLVQVSQLLYCKRCISEATLDEMERINQSRSLDDKKTTLLTAMKETVSSDYRKLKDIATVLSDVEETRDIGKKIMSKYEEKISQDDDNTVGQPQEVVDGNENCASDILRNNYSALSQSITQPVCVAEWLQEVISDQTLSCVTSSRGSVSDSRAVLLKAVRDAVHSNYKHLELFVTVLRKFSETAHIGDTIFEEYRKYFNCCDNDVKESDIYLAQQKSMSATSESSLVDDNEKDKHGNHKILFPRDMKKKFKEMRSKFGYTFFRVRHIFYSKKSALNIDEMKELIIDLFPDLKSQLSYEVAISELLNVVKGKCSIVDLCPLENLAFQFNIEEAEPIIESFKEEAKDFCKLVSVSLCLDEKLQAVATPSRLLCETVVFVFNWNPDEHTLQDINDVLDELEPLHKCHIQIDKVGTGRSVVVTCYCPAEYTDLLKSAVLEKINMLQGKGLKEFAIGNSTVWDTTQDLLAQNDELKANLKGKNDTITAFEIELATIKEQSENRFKKIEALKMDLIQNEEVINKLKNEISILRKEIMDRDKSKIILDLLLEEAKKEVESAKKLSEKRLQKIEELKLKLESNNDSPVLESSEASDTDTSIQEDENVEWSEDGVRLFNPSLDSCEEVISKLEDKHEIMVLIDSPSEIIQFLIPTILERKAIKQLTIIYSSLTPEDILSFSSQLSTNKSLTSLQIIHSSISDDGVIVLAQALQYNETLQYLYFNDNPDITSASAQSLAKLYKLSCLNLDNTNIDPKEVNGFDGITQDQ
ncbi:PREDICTED: uncharacterized protein LOC109585109 [Amphimedon queenslandica]|uniref:Death domain-containing protein n=1 Tax=Amphimedon queenslandica TaxID=400682 RepID=A0AAN0JIM0_AMPQE|nr:PREDICTED: uncharacterized protein LOC109585109 [Amphimedon queenslandica]|eukprot:XP_019856617.1 PREDICTED: uncharacterized protein LOC109585109 [Amphimedon queenslandica]